MTRALFRFTGHPSSCVSCKLVCGQRIWAQWTCLVEKDMDCIACYMRCIWHLKTRLPHAKSPTMQRCHTDLFVSDRHGTSYAPYVTSKEAFTASKEPYSAEVWDDLIVSHVSLVSRGLQCVAVSPWCHEGWSVLQCVAVCCTVLYCVAQCVLVHVRRLLVITYVAVCCSVLHCIAMCCSVWCSVLQCVAVCCSLF